jgi:hypothetical protein
MRPKLAISCTFGLAIDSAGEGVEQSGLSLRGYLQTRPGAAHNVGVRHSINETISASIIEMVRPCHGRPVTTSGEKKTSLTESRHQMREQEAFNFRQSRQILFAEH